LRIKTADSAEETLIFLSGGLLEVQPGLITVLADTAVRGHDLDEAKAIAAKAAAEEAMKNRSSDMDYAKAQAELSEAVAQIQAIERLRKTTH
jgi:F-type H+-transporting ATPase subunit epsilon